MFLTMVLLGIFATFVGIRYLRDHGHGSIAQPAIDLPAEEQPPGAGPSVSLIGTNLALMAKESSYQLPEHRPITTHSSRKIPVSVNYHLTHECNYKCGFCFHTATTSHLEPLENAQKATALLKEAGMKKSQFCRQQALFERKAPRTACQILQGDTAH